MLGKTAVVLVNYRGWRDTVAAARSVYLGQGSESSVVIVDNHSGDGSFEALKGELPEARVISASENGGFAAGCMLALQHIEPDTEYLFFLNNDATVEAHTIANLVSVSRSLNDRAALGAVLKAPSDGSFQFFGAERTRAGRLSHYELRTHSHLLSSTLISTDYIVGAALFVPRLVFERVGPFRTDYFLNYEETDWCCRAQRSGVNLYVVPSAEVHHKEGASLGAYDGPMQAYFLSRNYLLFLERFGSPVERLRGLSLTIREIRASLRRPKLNGALNPHTYGYLLGVRDYLLRRFGDCPRSIRMAALAFAAERRAEKIKGSSRPVS